MKLQLLLYSLKRGLKGTLAAALFCALLTAGAVLLFEERALDMLTEGRAQNPFLAALLGFGGSASLTSHLASLAYGLLLPLVGSIYLVHASSNLIARRVETGELPLHLALPISRRSYVLMQAAVIFAEAGILALAAAGGALLMAALRDFSQLHLLHFLWLNLGLMLLFFFAGCLGLMFSCGAQQRGQARRAGAAVFLLLLAIGMLALTDAVPDWIRYFSFYWLYAPQELAVGRLEPKNLAPAFAALVFLVVGLGRFLGRDIE